MNGLQRQRGQVLVIIVGTLFLGGSLSAGIISSGKALKAMKSDIEALQLDEPREDRALDVIKRWKAAAKPVLKTHAKQSDEILELLMDQYTTAEALTVKFSAQNENNANADSQVLALREELRSILSKEEWNRVFVPQ
jgi:hypothetical protein